MSLEAGLFVSVSSSAVQFLIRLSDPSSKKLPKMQFSNVFCPRSKLPLNVICASLASNVFKNFANSLTILPRSAGFFILFTACVTFAIDILNSPLSAAVFASFLLFNLSLNDNFLLQLYIKFSFVIIFIQFLCYQIV